MRIGTRSVLFGAHQFLLHPIFLAIAWTRLYGFPRSPALWLCFLVHDIGYWGKPDMDGDAGETHPELGARIVAALCGREWGEFCLLHSRYYARRLQKRYSRLCVADKFAICCTPWWLYLPLVWLTGELTEYTGGEKYRDRPYPKTPRAWWAAVQADMRKWVLIHKDADREDQWPNGFDPKDYPVNTLPGYLEGGYEPSRYRVTKADGSHNPDAKYLVLRYDANRDPHSIFAALAYAASVCNDNPDLAKGIIDAVAAEVGPAYVATYGHVFEAMCKVVNVTPTTHEGVTFALEMERQERGL